MGWVPANMWFTYLALSTPAGQLDYDLAVSTAPGQVPSLKAAGVTLAAARRIDLPTATAGPPGGRCSPRPRRGALAFGVGTVLNRRRARATS